MTSSWRNLVWGWKKITVSLGVETAEKMPHEKSPSLRFPEKKIVRAMRHRSVCICQVLPYITKACYSFIYYYDHHYNYYHYRLNAKARIVDNKCHQKGVCVLLKILMLQCSARSNSSRLLLLALGWDAYQEFVLCWRRSCPHLCPYVTKEELSNWSA